MDVKVTGPGTANPPLVQPYPGENVDFRELFGRVLRKRWWVIGSVFLFTSLFLYIALTMEPVYRATAILAPATVDRSSGLAGIASSALGGLASGLGMGAHDAETEEALAVLRSREFTESFIASQNLMPKLFADRWDLKRGTWKSTETKVPTPAKAYKAFDKIRSIVQDKKTGLISIEVEWTDRIDTALWTNELIRQLNAEMRQRAIVKADASLQFLEKELQTTPTVEERGALAHLVESQLNERMLANVTMDYSFRVVDRAIASDKDDPVRPQKRFLVLLGAGLGLVLGVILALMLDAFGSQRR